MSSDLSKKYIDQIQYSRACNPSSLVIQRITFTCQALIHFIQCAYQSMNGMQGNTPLTRKFKDSRLFKVIVHQLGYTYKKI